MTMYLGKEVEEQLNFCIKRKMGKDYADSIDLDVSLKLDGEMIDGLARPLRNLRGGLSEAVYVSRKDEIK